MPLSPHPKKKKITTRTQQPHLCFLFIFHSVSCVFVRSGRIISPLLLRDCYFLPAHCIKIGASNVDSPFVNITIRPISHQRKCPSCELAFTSSFLRPSSLVPATTTQGAIAQPPTLPPRCLGPRVMRPIQCMTSTTTPHSPPFCI